MAIHLDASATGWERPIRWIYRVIALLWIAKGLLGWAALMGIYSAASEASRLGEWSALFVPVVFPVIDVIAGVALWISWRWGGGVWALAALAYVGLQLFGMDMVQPKGISGVVFVLLALHGVRLIFIRSKSEQQMTIV